MTCVIDVVFALLGLFLASLGGQYNSIMPALFVIILAVVSQHFGWESDIWTQAVIAVIGLANLVLVLAEWSTNVALGVVAAVILTRLAFKAYDLLWTIDAGLRSHRKRQIQPVRDVIQQQVQMIQDADLRCADSWEKLNKTVKDIWWLSCQDKVPHPRRLRDTPTSVSARSTVEGRVDEIELGTGPDPRLPSVWKQIWCRIDETVCRYQLLEDDLNDIWVFNDNLRDSLRREEANLDMKLQELEPRRDWMRSHWVWLNKKKKAATGGIMKMPLRAPKRNVTRMLFGEERPIYKGHTSGVETIIIQQEVVERSTHTSDMVEAMSHGEMVERSTHTPGYEPVQAAGTSGDDAATQEEVVDAATHTSGVVEATSYGEMVELSAHTPGLDELWQTAESTATHEEVVDEATHTSGVVEVTSHGEMVERSAHTPGLDWPLRAAEPAIILEEVVEQSTHTLDVVEATSHGEMVERSTHTPGSDESVQVAGTFGNSTATHEEIVDAATHTSGVVEAITSFGEMVEHSAHTLGLDEAQSALDHEERAGRAAHTSGSNGEQTSRSAATDADVPRNSFLDFREPKPEVDSDSGYSSDSDSDDDDDELDDSRSAVGLGIFAQAQDADVERFIDALNNLRLDAAPAAVRTSSVPPVTPAPGILSPAAPVPARVPVVFGSVPVPGQITIAEIPPSSGSRRSFFPPSLISRATFIPIVAQPYPTETSRTPPPEEQIARLRQPPVSTVPTVQQSTGSRPLMFSRIPAALLPRQVPVAAPREAPVRPVLPSVAPELVSGPELSPSAAFSPSPISPSPASSPIIEATGAQFVPPVVAAEAPVEPESPLVDTEQQVQHEDSLPPLPSSPLSSLAEDEPTEPPAVPAAEPEVQHEEPLPPLPPSPLPPAEDEPLEQSAEPAAELAVQQTDSVPPPSPSPPSVAAPPSAQPEESLSVVSPPAPLVEEEVEQPEATMFVDETQDLPAPSLPTIQAESQPPQSLFASLPALPLFGQQSTAPTAQFTFTAAPTVQPAQPAAPRPPTQETTSSIWGNRPASSLFGQQQATQPVPFTFSAVPAVRPVPNMFGGDPVEPPQASWFAIPESARDGSESPEPRRQPRRVVFGNDANMEDAAEPAGEGIGDGAAEVADDMSVDDENSAAADVDDVSIEWESVPQSSIEQQGWVEAPEEVDADVFIGEDSADNDLWGEEPDPGPDDFYASDGEEDKKSDRTLSPLGSTPPFHSPVLSPSPPPTEDVGAEVTMADMAPAAEAGPSQLPMPAVAGTTPFTPSGISQADYQVGSGDEGNTNTHWLPEQEMNEAYDESTDKGKGKATESDSQPTPSMYAQPSTGFSAVQSQPGASQNLSFAASFVQPPTTGSQTQNFPASWPQPEASTAQQAPETAAAPAPATSDSHDVLTVDNVFEVARERLIPLVCQMKTWMVEGGLSSTAISFFEDTWVAALDDLRDSRVILADDDLASLPPDQLLNEIMGYWTCSDFMFSEELTRDQRDFVQGRALDFVNDEENGLALPMAEYRAMREAERQAALWEEAVLDLEAEDVEEGDDSEEEVPRWAPMPDDLREQADNFQRGLDEAAARRAAAKKPEEDAESEISVEE